MNHASLNEVFYVKVPNSFLGPQMPEGYTRGILHGVYGRSGQTLLTHILLESGAHWSGIPLIGIGVTDGTRGQSYRQPWACMGESPVVSKLKYLEGLRVKASGHTARHTGIVIDWGEEFSKHPQEHKPLSLLIDAEGGFLLLPNNYFIVSDLHFTETSEITKFYKRGESVWWEGDDVAP
jgi:hypothetical protein